MDAAGRRGGGAIPRAQSAGGVWPADRWRGPLLAVRLSSLGDVVLTSGPLRLLHERRPDLAIDLLTRGRYAAAMEGLPFLRRVLEAEKEPPGETYATLLDWQGGARGARAAARYAPGAERIGARRAALERRLLVVSGGRWPRSIEPFALRLGRSLTGAAVAAEALRPRIRARAELRALVRERLAALGRPERGWALLAPGASRPMKAVPEPLAAEIADRLRSRGFGLLRLQEPAPGEGEIRFERGGDGQGRARGPLEAVIALIAEMRLLVGSDSGILHLACGLDTPAVGLFGPTSPRLGFSPLGRARVAGVDLPCRPCHIHGPGRCWLGHARCWRDLDAAAVMQAAEAVLAEPARAAAARAEGEPGSRAGDQGRGDGER